MIKWRSGQEREHIFPMTSNRRSSSSSTQEPDLITLERKMPEWILFQRLLDDLQNFAQIQVHGYSHSKKYHLPLVSVTMGSKDPAAPVLGLFGGVHGLERIGSQVVLSLMNTFSQMILWDKVIQETLEKMRIVFMPLINPLGILHQTRSNPQGVDLMRNAPVDAEGKSTWLVGGHRLSTKLPWYRGAIGEDLQPESQALIQVCRQSFFQSPRVLTVDFHSGFGNIDRLWLPYAKSTRPFFHAPEAFAWRAHFDRTHPHHFYQIEPQAKNYTTHGDLWDYIYDEYRAHGPTNGVYIPWALEMGSWLWLRKNPWQAFSSLGPFNPMKPHRLKRILRRHNTLFDFLIRTTRSGDLWSDLSPEERMKSQDLALRFWYSHHQE